MHSMFRDYLVLLVKIHWLSGAAFIFIFMDSRTLIRLITFLIDLVLNVCSHLVQFINSPLCIVLKNLCLSLFGCIV